MQIHVPKIFAMFETAPHSAHIRRIFAAAVVLASGLAPVVSSGVGPVAEYDSRNDTFSPSSGSYARVQANFAERALLTSNHSYRTVDGSCNGYSETGENGVLAYRFSACSASDDTPFFDLCSFGTNSDLRGYTPGQYLDKTSFAAQVEYRRRFGDPFGVVGFGGVGGVAPSFGDYQVDKVLPDIGLGLRYRASDKYPVNIGVDFAFSKAAQPITFALARPFDSSERAERPAQAMI